MIAGRLKQDSEGKPAARRGTKIAGAQLGQEFEDGTFHDGTEGFHQVAGTAIF